MSIKAKGQKLTAKTWITVCKLMNKGPVYTLGDSILELGPEPWTPGPLQSVATEQGAQFSSGGNGLWERLCGLSLFPDSV